MEQPGKSNQAPVKGGGFKDADMQAIIGWILRIGVILSMGIVFIGAFLSFIFAHILIIEFILRKSIGKSWRDYNLDPNVKKEFARYIQQTCPSLHHAIALFLAYSITVPLIPFVWLLIKLFCSPPKK